METLRTTSEGLRDPDKLASMGLETDVCSLPPAKERKKMTTYLDNQNSLAAHAFNLVASLLQFNIASWAWHSDGWPGMLVLFASDLVADVERAWDTLTTDYKIYLDMKKMAKTVAFFRRCCSMSPFETTLMAEIGQLLHTSAVGDKPALLTWLKEFCTQLFQGWGQTKVIEDNIKVLRDREQRDVCSRVLKVLRQLGIMIDSGGLALHKREGLQMDSSETSSAKLTQKTFYAHQHQCSIDLQSILGTTTWPSFSAQGAEAMYAVLGFLRNVYSKDSLHLTCNAWRVSLVGDHTVLRTVSGQ